VKRSAARLFPLAVLLSITAMLVATVAPTFSATGASAATAGGGFFHTVCGYSHSAMDDPIVKPGMPGASHMHDFGGNNTTNAFSRLGSLSQGTTNCFVHAPDTMADRSGYWVPQLVFNGRPVSFTEQQAYYQSKIGPVRTPPRGLELVAGNSKATAPQSTNVVKFTCSGAAGSIVGANTAPPVCPDGSALKIVVLTPNCLDHALILQVDHQNDTARATYASGGGCPVGYDPIAQVRIEVKYPPGIDGRGTVAFASGPYYTMHADWFNAWNRRTLNRFVQRCINPGIDCGNTMP
jgi:hypothetical protein